MKKTAITIALWIFFLFCFVGCSTYMQPQGDTYYEFYDHLQRKVSLTKKPERVVSLFGSYADIWLTSGGSLVGVTDDAVNDRQLSLSSDVKIIGTVKAPNLELIFELMPDFVLLSTDIAAHVKIAETFDSSGITYAFFKEDSIADYLDMIDTFTDINERKDLYAVFGEAVKQKIDIIIDKYKDIASPSVLLIRSMSTKAKALKDDHTVGQMLKDLKADNIASRYPSLLEDLSMETIIKEDPQFIFVVTMGDVDKAIETLSKGIMAHPAWGSLSAVKNNNFYILPKDLFQYKPNARWSESYEYLEKILYL